MAITATPAVVQTVPSSRPYQIFTTEHCAFEDFAQYRDGGPSMVVLNGWGVSYSSTDRVFSSQSVVEAADADPMKVTLGAHKTISYSPYVSEKHALDGTRYATEVEARRAAFEAGLIGFMVYAAKEA